MAYGSDPSRQQRFSRVKPGDQPSARDWNRMCEILERLTAGDPRHPKKPTRAIKLIRLDTVMGQFGEGDPAMSGDGDSSMAHRRSGVVWYYDESRDDFFPTSNTETKTNITDALRLIYDAEEFVWCAYLEQSGHWHPLNPRTIRHARTCNDHGGSYPGCPANVFPIKFIKIEYEKTITPAYQTPGRTDLDGDASPDDFVLNLFEATDDNPFPYIPHDTNIWCYNVLGHWYTYIDLPCTDSSSSSSSQLSSLSELSSESSSSSDSSEISSQSSGGSSASSSLSSSSSQGSSLGLSSSSSSSGGSSVSVSESVQRNCLTLVKSLSFNSETCVLSYDTVCLCWPLDLGITFTTGDCTD